MQKITILGAGAFGTAIAQLLATNGHTVTLWCYEQEVADTITKTRINSRYLPNSTLHAHITAATSLQEAFTSHIIFVAIPVKHLRSIFEHNKHFVTKEHTWVLLSKGIETQTSLLPSQILQDVLPQTATSHIVVLSGPSYAAEVVTQQPTRVTIASDNHNVALTVQKLVTNNWFTSEISEDIVGVQLCAAYKNIAALCLGMLEGAGYGENTKALAFMQCLDEMQVLLKFYAAQSETLYGPAGLGDLVLTCYGKQSRNHTAGILFGKGETLQAIITKLGTEPEGINSLVAFQQLTKKDNLMLPICSTIHEIIFNSKSIADLVETIKR